jgi:hypothetical protein
MRDVPDSTLIGFTRHGADADLSLWIGDGVALDVAQTVERRIHDPSSVRESSWESRGDLRLEWALGDRATGRAMCEHEVFRFDEPDELDFDSGWIRTGFQMQLHRGPSLDLSVMPVWALLSSGTAPTEEYDEVGVEVGMDWRLGRRAWMSLSDEIGRRDYEVNATEDADTTGATDADLTAEPDGAYSDYLYNRLTLTVGADPLPGLRANLFVHWQPEDHAVHRHDADTRIVSGGVEYRF